MARIVTLLTNTQVKQAKPKDKVYKLADGEGLQLRIKPNGTKSWLLDYFKPYSKKRTSISFGMYPALSLADARKKRQQARELLANEIDPKEHKDQHHTKQQQEINNTLQAVASNYADGIWSSLELHIFPQLGSHPISAIKAPLTIDVLKPIAKGSLETVKRLTQRLNEVMTFAVNTGLIHANFVLSLKTKEKLDEITKHDKSKINETIERLITDEYKRIDSKLLVELKKYQ